MHVCNTYAWLQQIHAIRYLFDKDDEMKINERFAGSRLRKPLGTPQTFAYQT